MKQLYFTVILASCLNVAFSQTLHSIIFVNTQDRTIGSSAAKNLAHIRGLAAEAASKGGFTPLEHLFDGEKYTFDNLQTILTSLQVQPNDAVFFYLNSHGFKSSSDSPFPRVVIETTRSDRYLFPSDRINAMLRERCNGCALNLTVIQACNRQTSRTGDLEIELGPAAVDYSDQNYKNLFNSKQNIIVTSSQRGKTSIALVDIGSVFTMAFKKALMESSRNEQPATLTWDRVLESAKSITKSRRGHKNRYPVWRIAGL